jgi:hypothetical protein
MAYYVCVAVRDMEGSNERVGQDIELTLYGVLPISME